MAGPRLPGHYARSHDSTARARARACCPLPPALTGIGSPRSILERAGRGGTRRARPMEDRDAPPRIGVGGEPK